MYYQLGFQKHKNPCFNHAKNTWVDSHLDAWLHSFWHRRLHEGTASSSYTILNWLLRQANMQPLKLQQYSTNNY